MKLSKPTVYTVGYEGRTVEQFLSTLRNAGVTRVIDVRELPLSRKKGFSKSPMKAALEAQGIEYIHLRDAGNPYRDKRNDIKLCLALYRKHLNETPEVIELLKEHLEGQTVALLCVESEPQHCHRSILAARLGSRVVDL
jgi:uncharacterized protein (DUF488 family)